ncbi:MAG: hypothetical protein JWN30_414 [Bacilli bacterium]|nr:hypothetical protein [Bacilli bacterium]
MMSMIPYTIDNHKVIGIHVTLPKTNLLAFSTDIGYIMCGALDIQLLNEKLASREIVAARAVGVRTLDELLEAPIESSTVSAEKLGIHPGVSGRDALRLMLSAQSQV